MPPLPGPAVAQAIKDRRAMSVQKADEKIAVATQTHDLVDGYIRQLGERGGVACSVNAGVTHAYPAPSALRGVRKRADAVREVTAGPRHAAGGRSGGCSGGGGCHTTGWQRHVCRGFRVPNTGPVHTTATPPNCFTVYLVHAVCACVVDCAARGVRVSFVCPWE